MLCYGKERFSIHIFFNYRIYMNYRNNFDFNFNLNFNVNFIFYSITILSLNEQRQVRHSQTTGIKTISLDRNEETRLIYLDSELVYPVLISLNLLVTTPNKPPAPPIEEVVSLPSTSGQSAQIADNSNSNESDISTIGATKSNSNSDDNNLNDDG